MIIENEVREKTQQIIKAQEAIKTQKIENNASIENKQDVENSSIENKQGVENKSVLEKSLVVFKSQETEKASTVIKTEIVNKFDFKTLLFAQIVGIPLDTQGKVIRPKCLDNITCLPFLDAFIEALQFNIFSQEKVEDTKIFNLITAFGCKTRGDFSARLMNYVVSNSHAMQDTLFVIQEGFFSFDTLDHILLSKYNIHVIDHIAYNEILNNEVSYTFGDFQHYTKKSKKNYHIGRFSLNFRGYVKINGLPI